MRETGSKKGFTLVELLVALVIAGIVLTSVATLAYAMGTANSVTDDLSLKQAQVRYATLSIQDLIRHSRLICFADSDEVVIWRADDNNDENINIGELTYIESGPNGDYLRICEFPSSNDAVINLSAIGPFTNNWWSIYCPDVDYIQVIPQCSNVKFSFDTSPPQSRFVGITFNYVENDIVRQCQITGQVRGWAGNLLEDGNITSDDD